MHGLFMEERMRGEMVDSGTNDAVSATLRELCTNAVFLSRGRVLIRPILGSKRDTESLTVRQQLFPGETSSTHIPHRHRPNILGSSPRAKCRTRTGRMQTR